MKEEFSGTERQRSHLAIIDRSLANEAACGCEIRKIGKFEGR